MRDTNPAIFVVFNMILRHAQIYPLGEGWYFVSEQLTIYGH